MKVIKRSGQSVAIKFDQITTRISNLTKGLSKGVDATKIAQKVSSSIYDGISTQEIDSLSAEIAIGMMTENPEIVCTRLMPCPGPTGDVFLEKWKEIVVDPYCYFSLQAAIWSVPWLMRFFEGVVRRATPLISKYPQYSRNQFWLLVNPCETKVGTDIAVELGGRFVGYPRIGRWSNAVYLSPWPYRPTAVEKGVIQPWATEMLKREEI
jgi:hypothetical protein